MELRVRETSIHYEEYGNGRPIVVLHGMPSDRVYSMSYYEPTLATRDGWRRIYPDMPGMGQTRASESIQTYDDYLAVMVDFIDEVTRGEPFALVGTSWGGLMARAIVHERFDRVIGLHLAQPTTGFGPPPVPPPTVIAENPDVVAQVRDDEQIYLDVYVVQSQETLDSFRTAVKPGLGSANMDFLRAMRQKGVFSFDLDDTPILQAPVLITAGRQDSMVGYQRPAELIELYPRGTLAVLDRAGHALDLEQKVLFGALLNEWLDRVEEWIASLD